MGKGPPQGTRLLADASVARDANKYYNGAGEYSVNSHMVIIPVERRPRPFL